MLNTKQVMESAALRLFRKSDKENKGFIVKRDMQVRYATFFFYKNCGKNSCHGVKF